MLSFIFVILSLTIAFIISTISVLSSEKTRTVKFWLILFTFIGFVIGSISSFKEWNEKIEIKLKKEKAEHELTKLKNNVGDLSILNELTGDAKYYVRVAIDKKRDNLEPYLKAIENKFSGAKSSNMVGIIEAINSKNVVYYELVFGQNLDVVSAEVFHRLAMSHGFPPDGQIAQIMKHNK